MPGMANRIAGRKRDKTICAEPGCSRKLHIPSLTPQTTSNQKVGNNPNRRRSSPYGDSVLVKNCLEVRVCCLAL